ncbi:unnamed protein product [Pylaiella littoralis]
MVAPWLAISQHRHFRVAFDIAFRLTALFGSVGARDGIADFDLEFFGDFEGRSLDLGSISKIIGDHRDLDLFTYFNGPDFVILQYRPAS